MSSLGKEIQGIANELALGTIKTLKEENERLKEENKRLIGIIESLTELRASLSSRYIVGFDPGIDDTRRI